MRSEARSTQITRLTLERLAAQHIAQDVLLAEIDLGDRLRVFLGQTELLQLFGHRVAVHVVLGGVEDDEVERGHHCLYIRVLCTELISRVVQDRIACFRRT